MTGDGHRSIDRRRFVGIVGAGTLGLIAGCLGGGDDDSGETDDSDDGHPFAGTVDHPGDEPLEFTGEYSCPVCNMTPGDYQDWQAQLALDGGEGVLFDTPGCLFAYVAEPPTDDEITSVWVTDFESGDLIDGAEAFYVIVTDDEPVPEEVMGLNPRPFEDESDAIAYLDEWDAEELTEDDIIGLDDVDRETAAIYRGNRLP